MHENAPLLAAKRRERTGSRYSKRVRDAGGMPAIVYGHGETPEPVYVDAKQMLTHVRDGDKVFQMQIDGGDAVQVVLLKDLQFDYLGNTVVHCDFARVDLSDRVNTRVHLSLVGDAKGLKSAGSVLMHPTNELEIECTLSNMPDEITVDISEMAVGDSLTAGEIKLPLETMVLLTDPGAIVAQIVLKATEADADGAEGAEVESGSQPEVISEKKSEED